MDARLDVSAPRLADEQALNLVLLNLLQLIYKTMEVSGSFSLVLVNPAPEKQFANLGQASAFLLGDLAPKNLIAPNSQFDYAKSGQT
jgi:hypothetical protein